MTAPKAVSGTSAKPTGWLKYGGLATALSQSITITLADVSPDGQVHLRFKLSAVMENPAHQANQQPFYAVQINNLTTGRKGKNPLFFQWSYAAQPGVPWNSLTQKGTNSGSNATYNYIDWQNFDVPLSSTEFSIGDQIELVVLAAGCSPGGHDGHIYLDGVTTQTPSSGLGISATGPATVTPGSTITYEYTFTNYGSTSLSNVCVDAHMPLTQNTNPAFETIYNSVSVIKDAGNTQIGTCTYVSTSETARCCVTGSFNQNDTGKFTMTVSVPEHWKPNDGPINNGNFPIYADNFNPVLGNLVQTEILSSPPPPASSYLVVDLSGLQIGGQNPILNTGDAYSGQYTCTNVTPGTVAASPGTCDITNLPDGLSVTGCTKNGAAWTSPDSIALNEVVTCRVAGFPTSMVSREYLAEVSSDASNNTNGITNHDSMPFFIQNNPVTIPATLDGQPTLTPVKICCGRPVVVYDLPIESDLPATYEIISTTGQVQCRLGSSGLQNYVKLFGQPGTCTVIATKDGQISAPLVLQSN